VNTKTLALLGNIGRTLASDAERAEPWDALLRGACALTRADAAVLYVVAGDGLRPTAVRVPGSATAPDLPLQPALPLPRPDGEMAETRSVAAYAAHHAISVNIADLSESADFDLTGIRELDRLTGYRARSLLCVPIGDAERGVVAVLQLINARNPATGAVTRFGAEAQRLAETLAWQTAVPGYQSRAADAAAAEAAVTVIKGPGITRRLDAPLVAKRLAVAGATAAEAEAITHRVFREIQRDGLAEILDMELWDRVCLAIGQRLRGGLSDRVRAWSAFRRSGLPLVVLIGGCSGSGKSTLAAELSLRLDIGRIQSSDTLREVMRLLVSPHLAPEIHRSTYQAWQALPRLPASLGEAERVVEGFRGQADKVAVAIRGVVQRSLAERESAIVEGAHLDPSLQEGLQGDADTRALVVPMLVAVADRDELSRHFQWRSVLAPTRSDRRHLEDFEHIWQLQQFLVDQADRHGVAVIPNVGIELCTRHALEVISTAVLERFPPGA